MNKRQRQSSLKSAYQGFRGLRHNEAMKTLENKALMTIYRKDLTLPILGIGIETHPNFWYFSFLAKNYLFHLVLLPEKNNSEAMPSIFLRWLPASVKNRGIDAYKFKSITIRINSEFFAQSANCRFGWRFSGNHSSADCPPDFRVFVS